MVRVISVHHFSKQHIQTVEQPTASCVAPPDRLLLALSSHCIEVRDLNNGAELMFSFPTVDEVKQIIHCLNGNYVATLETKCNRQNHLTFYVRIYANWDSVAALQQSKMTSSGVSLGISESGMVQPMRARIAGRVTPTTSQSELSSLEMIELPVKRRPDSIACCQISGNILVQSTKYLMIYKFHVKTHDISKLRFIDFEELSLILEISFKPTQLNLCENYIACMNDSSLHLFTISHAQPEFNDAKKQKDYQYYTKNEDAPLNYRQMLEEEEMFGTNLITVNLPSIVKENSAIHKHCPYTCCDSDMTVNIKSSSPIDNWSNSYQINNLLQLKLKPMVIEGAHRQIIEEFKCLVLKPLYVPNNHKPTKKSDVGKKALLKSDYSQCLNSVVCMFTTQQEGYLYMFCDNNESTSMVDNCVTVYPFTAPIYKIVLEDYMLHALTETGLESYTLRIGHQLMRNVHKVNNINLACPSVKESVCLVGLRPFLGVEQLLLAENYLILLANSEGSPTHSCSSSNSSCSNWTLYNLELPNALTLYNDFKSLADMHQFSSPQTYSHLISEAHVVLKASLMLTKWSCKNENAVNLVHPMKIDLDEIDETYKISCKLLGDYFIMCTEESNYTLSLPYYKMSKISPLDVLKRVQELQNLSDNTSMVGLLFYLKTVLLQIKTWTEADVLFTLLGEQNFVDTVLDLFNKHDPKSLSTLVLKNNLLREYAMDKLINIFVQNESKEIGDLVALSVLYLQRYMQQEAKQILESVPVDQLQEILKSNWELLFDTSGNASKSKDSVTTFSELTALLVDKKPNMLAELLAYLITDMKAVNIEKVLKVFLDFLPSHVSKDGTNGSMVLQVLLEKYFKNYYSLPENVYKKTNYEPATFEALKILVRTYLSQLQIWHLKGDKKSFKLKDITYLKDDVVNDPLDDRKDDMKIEDCQKLTEHNEDYLFSKIRWLYLDQIPPFAEDNLLKITSTVKGQKVKKNPEMDLILRKLQALLCSQLVPKQVINEMLSFFKMNADLKGNTSLQSIVLPVKDGTPFLLEKCPQCLLQYGKDRFTKDDEWKQLIGSLQQKIATINKDDSKNVYSFHMCILKDILTYLATNMSLQRFLILLPPKSDNGSVSDETDSSTDDNENNTTIENMCSRESVESENYEPYILICKQTAHANHIKRLITATGQKLLTTLNL